MPPCLLRFTWSEMCSFLCCWMIVCWAFSGGLFSLFTFSICWSLREGQCHSLILKDPRIFPYPWFSSLHLVQLDMNRSDRQHTRLSQWSWKLPDCVPCFPPRSWASLSLLCLGMAYITKATRSWVYVLSFFDVSIFLHEKRCIWPSRLLVSTNATSSSRNRTRTLRRLPTRQSPLSRNEVSGNVLVGRCWVKHNSERRGFFLCGRCREKVSNE